MINQRRIKEDAFYTFFICCIILSLSILIAGCDAQSTAAQVVPANSQRPVSTPTQPAAPLIPQGKDIPTAMNMGMSSGTSITKLQAPKSGMPIKNFTLVAQKARVELANGTTVDAWTYNGTAPGTTIRVTQGDLVVVTLVNHLPFGVSIHWHGVDLANSADGVAGLTQDAVKPGETYTYRFVAKDPGTYWYHSHQFSYEETTGGLYGLFIVDPLRPTTHDDVDYSVALHDWTIGNQTVLSMNDVVGRINQTAEPGQWVRLRIANTANLPHMLTLLGAPFMVAALDGHDVNKPQMMTAKPLLIGGAQRYDVRFQMPQQGSISLVTSKDQRTYQQTPALVLGEGPQAIPTPLPKVQLPFFSFTNYGEPEKGAITTQTHFDSTYTVDLGSHLGHFMDRSGRVYTFNGKTFLDNQMIMVKEGQLVKIHLDNQTAEWHPIHLHGPAFAVIAYNGTPLTGSPIYLDTINIAPHDNYDIVYTANNPGLWMMHCHNLLHAYWGMDMVIAYEGYTTPFTIGTQSGNFPD